MIFKGPFFEGGEQSKTWMVKFLSNNCHPLLTMKIQEMRKAWMVKIVILEQREKKSSLGCGGENKLDKFDLKQLNHLHF